MKTIIAFFAIVLFSIPNVNAQFLKKLGEKVKEATEKTIERKVEAKTERTTEKVLDSIFDASNKTKDTKNQTSTTSNENESFENLSINDFLSGSGETTSEPKYIFPVTATIEVEDLTSNLKKTTMKQGYGKDALITEMEKNGDPVIIDMKNQSAIILNTNGGTAQVMSLKWMEKMMGNHSISTEETSDVVHSVNKTGKTKMMNSYKCHEYIISHQDGIINAWYAPEVKFEYQDYLRGIAKLFSKKKAENPIQLLNTNYGYVMEMTVFNKKNEKQNSMKVVALEEKVRMINMDLFKVQKL